MDFNSQTRELGECLSKIIDHRGKTPKKLGSDWVQVGLPTLSAKNVNSGRVVAEDSIRFVTPEVYKKWMNTGDVERGDCLLVSEGATLGECMYWDNEYPIVLGQRLFCLRANSKILYPRYLYQYMTSAAFQAEVIGRTTGTSVLGLRQSDVLKLKIKLPSLVTQKFIGDTLYFLDKKIELNRQMNATLEAIAQALFKSWFVDFDPVIDNALAAGNPIPQPLQARAEARKALGDQRQPLPDVIQKQFPSAFDYNDELGWIPERWRDLQLSDLINIKHGFAFKGEYFSSSPTTDILLTPGNFYAGGGFKSDKLKFYDGPITEEYILQEADLILIPPQFV